MRVEAGGERRGESDEDDDDMFTIDMSSDEEEEADQDRSVYGDAESKLSSTYTHSGTDWPQPQRPGPEDSVCVPADYRLSVSCPQHTSHLPPHT
ncbi:hypothetical protein CRUP_016771, partial [Coryphaenoides rupestris]